MENLSTTAYVLFSLVMVVFSVLFIVAIHNFIRYILMEQRYSGPAVQLAIFYGLAIPFLAVCVAYNLLILIKGSLVERTSEILF